MFLLFFFFFFFFSQTENPPGSEPNGSDRDVGRRLRVRDPRGAGLLCQRGALGAGAAALRWRRHGARRRAGRPWFKTNSLGEWDWVGIGRFTTAMGSRSHFGVGECTTHVGTDFSGDWDVHWYGVLTHGRLSLALVDWLWLKKPVPKMEPWQVETSEYAYVGVAQNSRAWVLQVLVFVSSCQGSILGSSSPWQLHPQLRSVFFGMAWNL